MYNGNGQYHSIYLYIDSHNLHQIQTENRQKVSLKKSFNEIPLIETAPHTQKKKIYKYQHCSLFQIPYNASQNETGSDVCQACMQWIDDNCCSMN